MFIAIFGQKGNGKSEIAKILRSYFPHYMVTGFAHTIKHHLCQMTGISMNDLEKYKNDPNPSPGWTKNVRTVLQWLGEGMREHTYREVWINATTNMKAAIIQDGRYENEAKAIKAKGGVNILVVRPDKYVHNAAHPSESWVGDVALAYRATIGPLGYFGDSIEYMDKWYNEYRQLFDFVIWNDGTIDQLNEKVHLLGQCLIREKKL